MHASALPEIFALTVFLVSFGPLVRRAGGNTTMWLIAWFSLLIHYAGLLISDGTGPGHIAGALISIWGLELCGLFFIFAAVSLPATRSGRLFALTVSAPILLQSTLYVLGLGSHSTHIAVYLLLFVPGIQVLLRPDHRAAGLTQLSGACAVLAIGLILVSAFPAFLILNAILCLLFLAAAYFYVSFAPTVGRGVVVAAVSLTVWAFIYPATVILANLAHPIFLPESLWNGPMYAVACGMMVTLLEKQFGSAERLALEDSLTGLPNARQFEQKFAEAMIEREDKNHHLACIIIDVDGFKHINDSLGHVVGDELLKSLAVRLRWHMGPQDLLARTGGDVFTAILPGIYDEGHLRFVAGAMIAAMRVPLSVRGHSVRLTLSVGIAISPQHGEDTATLRRAADDAMFFAKSQGGGILALASEETSRRPVTPTERGYAGSHLRSEQQAAPTPVPAHASPS